MIKPNWDNFKAKFSENPQNNFEWFCYLLFCKRFNKPYGIFRYKNQSAIETNPIEKDKDVIGWQAKFYDTALSNHKDNLLRTIEKSKRDYSDITKLLFYTNQEWGQNKGHKPQGLIEIEEKAKDLNITLEWRTASFFESEFVSIENEIIAKHFFATDKSIFDLMEEQQKHTENILSEIQTCIVFNNQVFEIDRIKCLEKLKNESQQISILSGIGGVGKTVLIKKLYEQLKEKTPFYVFKATEFELRNINDLLADFSFYDFAEAYKDEKNKIIVIDSTEKLLDLKNTDPFKEFLSTIIKNKWKIIFTTRDNYLEDLNYHFFEIYNIAPLNININNLELKELNTISGEHSFTLPKDEKLMELIRNPFHLNEYLKFYKDKEELDYSGFKKKLWNRNIKKSKPEREQCFLKVAIERANKGQFFINPICGSNILDKELTRDGILGYETAGYFITHDIYEEWALERIIESEFIKKSTNQEFFEKIRQSLPIRRSFRNWLSEKLLLKNEGIKSFIEEVIGNEGVNAFWKDEILVSVLLSDYSKAFFVIFKDDLLDNDQELLKKLTFILRIACKEVDEDFFKQLGIKNLNLFSLKYILTKPKGQGWKSLIKFIFDNLDTIGIKNINFVLPVVHDWNSKFKKGETTRLSSLIALQYYQWLIKEDVYFSRDNTEDNLLQTILYGSSEIEAELKEIFEDILSNKWKNYRAPYYELSKVILTKLEGISVSKVLPKYVLQLADLFWSYTPRGKRFYSDSRIGVEKYFNIEEDHQDYFPASSYQTPIFWLLQFALKETIDFILEFTNKTVDSFAKSDFAKHEVEEIEVFIDNNQTIKQYICNRLWCIYRDTQVSPHVLESMHMALEKFFIENAKHADSKTLENWLLYLLKNSKSASISAVVTSIVLAHPEKTFNVAKILFQTKKFFLYETSRLILDQGHKSQLSMLKNNFGINYKNELHENERLEACDDKHRKWALEHLFLNYQCFRNKRTSEKEAENRQKILWQILDNYYKELPAKSEETDSDKTWRLFLARMDRRKMKPTTEKTDDGIAIYWNPEIEPDLKEYSEKSLAKSSGSMKYTPLKLWADHKLNYDDKYKQYVQYENNPKLALKEVKDIIAKLKKSKAPEFYKIQHSEEKSFFLFNHSIPAYVCSVLIRDYLDELPKEEISFCKDIILEVASSSLRPNYQYQISDGTQPAISVLPILIEVFPEEKESIKIILLLTLFNDYPIGMGSTSFNLFSVMAIQKLWKRNISDAQSLLHGYLLLKPRYKELKKRIQEENYEKGIYELHENQILERFMDENEDALQNVIENKLALSNLRDIEKLDLSIQKTAFQLIPKKTVNADHQEIVKIIISAFAEKLLSDDRDDKIDYKVKHDFFETYAYFVLSSQKHEIQDYLKPFLDNFNCSESVADLFQEFVLAEDRLDTYDNFWMVWNLFKEKVIEICKDGDRHWYVEKIVKSYLFAQVPWKETAKDWHTLKDSNKRFFKEVSQKIGHCPSALYAISKLLNDIGSPYIDDGVSWVSNILDNNRDLMNKKLEVNTIYYIENLVRKYTFKNREKVRKTKALKDEVLIILNFLIEKGSVVGYMLRESIL
jgi:hypothetical protein